MGLVFNADARAEQIKLSQDIAQIDGRIGIVAIGPDGNIFDIGGVTRLSQIGRAGHQHCRSVSLHHEALEEAKAERVIAGQPVHAFLCEQQQSIKLLFLHLQDQTVATCSEFFRLEVKGHVVLLIVYDSDGGNLTTVIRLVAVRRAPVGIELIFIGISALAQCFGFHIGLGQAICDEGPEIKKLVTFLA